jgi:hypothetical protein
MASLASRLRACPAIMLERQTDKCTPCSTLAFAGNASQRIGAYPIWFQVVWASVRLITVSACLCRWVWAPTPRRRRSRLRISRLFLHDPRLRSTVTFTSVTTAAIQITALLRWTPREEEHLNLPFHPCVSFHLVQLRYALPSHFCMGQFPNRTSGHISASTTHSCTNASGAWQDCLRKRGTTKGRTRSAISLA